MNVFCSSCVLFVSVKSHCRCMKCQMLFWRLHNLYTCFCWFFHTGMLWWKHKKNTHHFNPFLPPPTLTIGERIITVKIGMLPYLPLTLTFNFYTPSCYEKKKIVMILNLDYYYYWNCQFLLIVRLEHKLLNGYTCYESHCVKASLIVCVHPTFDLNSQKSIQSTIYIFVPFYTDFQKGHTLTWIGCPRVFGCCLLSVQCVIVDWPWLIQCLFRTKHSSLILCLWSFFFTFIPVLTNDQRSCS
jgi:hypothetical protein